MDYPQDPRTVGMLGGLGPRGEAIPITRQHTVDVATQWPVSPHTPHEVAAQLRVARELFVHCLLVWEFGAVGAAWSLMAVESCLRWALSADTKASFKNLTARARGQGLLDRRPGRENGRRSVASQHFQPPPKPARPLGGDGQRSSGNEPRYRAPRERDDGQSSRAPLVVTLLPVWFETRSTHKVQQAGALVGVVSVAAPRAGRRAARVLARIFHRVAGERCFVARLVAAG